MSNLVLKLDAFIRAIGIERQVPYAVFLGAGSSISSGIPSAELCIWEWKRSIFLTNNPGVERQFSELTLLSVKERIQRWLDSKGVYPVMGSLEEYSFYIEECFPISQHRQQYFAEKIRMANPFVGYKLLCLLAEEEIFNSVWTTNFDGLVIKAAANFNITPIEVGIDCQHRVFRQPRRSELLCISIHGDYRYDKLKNTDRELQQQEVQLKQALVSDFNNKSLIVIGYSGRDKSVMDALEDAYSRPGASGLYWCGFGSEISEPVLKLLHTARAAGRMAYFVPTMGFDDTLKRLALHCLSRIRNEQARDLLSEVKQKTRQQNEQFVIPQAPCKSLIKSNIFEIDCPSEVFSFGVKEWPESPWDWVKTLSNGKSFVAVPHRKKILAIGLLDEIRDSIGEQLSGLIERTPVTEADKIQHGAVNALMRRALLEAFSISANVITDGKRFLWERQALDRKRRGEQECFIHRAVVLYLRRFSERMFLIVRPTVVILDINGNELSQDITKVVKMEVLGYQHNNKFNQELEQWRKQLFPNKGIVEFEYPLNCGSTFRFRIRTAPLFAQIGSRTRQKPIPIDNRIRPIIKQQGIEIPEPQLLFTNKFGTQYTRDIHPLRGLIMNRPFDFSLSIHELAQSIRLSVVCPNADNRLLSQYLYQIEKNFAPNKTERDYLINYPGFQKIYGIPIEIPGPGDEAWMTCPEPKIGRTIKESCLELANSIIRSIDIIVATQRPHVVVIFIPDRWSELRGYKDEQEHFDLHDFVKAYCVQKGIATQFLEQKTIISEQQCRVWWWLSVALYAKAMRTPWVLETPDPNTAFVGLGFTINQFASKGRHVVLGCSHLYNAQGEGLQFRLSTIENPIIVRRNPHMSYDDARRIAEMIRQLFFESRFKLPTRVVVHKQTRFLDSEKNGLLDGLSGVEDIDLLEINIDSAIRYVSSVVKQNGSFDEDNYPVRRGTVVKLDDHKAAIWCHGVTDAVIQGWKYFQGKRHIPAPLVLHRHAGSTSLESLATEIIGLAKMDWNSADLYSRLPATIYTSKQIARIGAKLQRFDHVSYDYRLFM